MSYARNAHLLELITPEANGGSFSNTTIGGSITGESLDLGVIDDAIKGRHEASSTTIRDTAWDWFTDDFYSRFDDKAGMIAIATAWHIDDPISRLINQFKDVAKIVRYPAIAVEDEKYRKKGEALFPEHKPLEFLNERKVTMLPYNWAATYQQNPQIVGGDIFQRDWMKGKYYKEVPTLEVKRIVQSWDTAQKTKQHNDPSCCTTWLELNDGRHFLVDVYVKKMKYPDLKRAIISKNSEFKPDAVLVEDKSSGSSIIQDDYDDKIPFISIEPCGDKLTRAETASLKHCTGFINHPEKAEWLTGYEDELFGFPAAVHDDQVDSTSQYLNWVKSYIENDYFFG